MGFRDYLLVIRQRKLQIITVALLFAAAAMGLSLLQPRAYRGEATVLIAPSEAGSASSASAFDELFGIPSRGMQNQVRLMQRPPVAERAVKKLRLSSTPAELLDLMSVSVDRRTAQVTISVIDASPRRATADAVALATSYVEWARDLKRAGVASAAADASASTAAAKAEMLALASQTGSANASQTGSALSTRLQEATAKQATLVDALVTLRLQEQLETVPAQLVSIRSRIASTERQLSDLKAQIVAMGAGTTADGTQRQDPALQAAVSRYISMSASYEALKVAEQREMGPASFLSAAESDPEPVVPAPLRDGVLGLLLGLVLGICGALLVKRPVEIVESPEEAATIYGAPVLSIVPAEYLKWDERRGLTIIERPGSRAAEAYRLLCGGMTFLNFEHDIKTVTVVAAAPGDGKATVAANLAAGLAMAGSKVVLINGDFNRPSTARFFDVNDALGLSDVLVGRMPIGAALQTTHDARLQILTCGKVPPNPAAMLGSRTMTELIDALEETYDWVIVDSPPVLKLADAASTVRWSDGVLVVTRSGASERAAALSARDLLASVGSRTLGVVVWGVEEEGGQMLADAEQTSGPSSLEGITSEFTMPDDRPSRRLSQWILHWPSKWLAGWPVQWQSGWHLALLLFLVVLIFAAIILLNGWFGTAGLLGL